MPIYKAALCISNRDPTWVVFSIKFHDITINNTSKVQCIGEIYDKNTWSKFVLWALIEIVWLIDITISTFTSIGHLGCLMYVHHTLAFHHINSSRGFISALLRLGHHNIMQKLPSSYLFQPKNSLPICLSKQWKWKKIDVNNKSCHLKIFFIKKFIEKCILDW